MRRCPKDGVMVVTGRCLVRSVVAWTDSVGGGEGAEKR